MLVREDALIVPVCFWNVLPFILAAREDAAMVNDAACARTRRKNAQDGRGTIAGGRQAVFRARAAEGRPLEDTQLRGDNRSTILTPEGRCSVKRSAGLHYPLTFHSSTEESFTRC